MALPILAILAALFVQNEVSWARLFATTLPSYIINTGLLMVMVAALAGSMGVITAWAVASCEFPGRKLLSWLLILPLATPAYIIAYVYTDLMEYYGPVQSGLRGLFGWSGNDYSFPNIRNLPGAALMLSLVLYPYVYLLARTAFLSQGQGQWQAARSLGLSPRRAFFRVALPAARPAIAGGLALVLMETLADFGVADFFAVPTFSTGIFRTWLAEGNRPVAMKLAAFMLLIVILLVTLEAVSRRGRTSSKNAIATTASRMTLSKPLAALTTLLCVLPVLFGFIIPMARLAFLAMTNGDAQGQDAFTRYAVNSFTTAAIVAIIVTLIAISLAYMRRNSSGRFM
ncbi:MAG: ABC transporter permease subunit, partial [Marinomonas sp.]